MKSERLSKNVVTKTIIRRCHACGELLESSTELSRCSCCGKSFMPLNYFGKIHAKSEDLKDLYASSHELDEKDIIRGLFVIW